MSAWVPDYHSPCPVYPEQWYDNSTRGCTCGASHSTGLTYYVDGTPVTMTWAGGTRHGIARGRVGSGLPNTYDFQTVEWPDGSTDNVAPQVLTRTKETA